MEREQIAQLAHDMENRNDILALLNRIKQDDAVEMGVQFFPFTMKQIRFYCNPNHAFHRYRQFKIKKKSGGFRLITAPRNKTYKMLLQYVNIILKALYTPSDYAMGFTEGRSVVANAEKHLGQNYVLNIDLKDFFPSVDRARIRARLQIAPFNFPEEVALTIAGLCCIKHTGKEGIPPRFVLPQGAPTSPIITNMICDKLDRRLAGLAKRFGLNYTRYADDITFSSMHNVYQPNGDFWTELRRIIADQNFTINEDKTRLQKRGSRQEVTGVMVTEKLNVSQKYVRDIRNILYVWERHGFNVAYSRFFPKYKSEKGHVKKGMPDLINVLDGKLMYLKMVKGENDPVYLRLYRKFKALADQTRDILMANNGGINYIETTPVLEFEQKNNTEVVILWTKDKIDGDKIIPARRYAYFMLDGKRIKASVNKVITKEEDSQKELLAISSCRDGNDKPFWLVHKKDKVTVFPPEPVNIEQLNNELDALLNKQDG